MRHFERYSAELQELEARFRSEAAGKPVLKVLEAGCGREWHLRTKGVALELTGVDLDEAALSHRRDVKKDLDQAIIGDLRTAPLPSEAYDIVYSSFVLEHIPGAELALDNMVRSLKQGGLLIVRVPDLGGAQTFFARRLPRWVAIAFYRHAWKIKDAGKPGFAPYKAYYDPVISRGGFQNYCSSRGLTLVEAYGVGTYSARGTGVLGRLAPIAARLVAVLSFGRVHDRHVDLTFIARKDGAHASSPSQSGGLKRTAGRG